MKLTPVDQIPKMNGYHKLQELIEEFTNGDAKIVKVEFSETDYKSPAVCRSCLAAATVTGGSFLFRTQELHSPLWR